MCNAVHTPLIVVGSVILLALPTVYGSDGDSNLGARRDVDG